MNINVSIVFIICLVFLEGYLTKKSIYHTDALVISEYTVGHYHNFNPDATKINFPVLLSFNISKGFIIPEAIDRLVIADKAITELNIINGATLVQPCILLTGQAEGNIALSDSEILKVNGKPHKWENRALFYHDSMFAAKEFTGDLNVFSKNINIVFNTFFLTIQKTGELISVVVGYMVENKLEIICKTSIVTEFNPNRLILKKEPTILVD